MKGGSGVGLEAGAASRAEGVPDHGPETETERAEGKPDSEREAEEERAGSTKGEPTGGQEIDTGPALVLNVEGLADSAQQR